MCSILTARSPIQEPRTFRLSLIKSKQRKEKLQDDSHLFQNNFPAKFRLAARMMYVAKLTCSASYSKKDDKIVYIIVYTTF